MKHHVIREYPMSDIAHRRYRAALLVVLALIAVVLVLLLEHSSRIQRTGAGTAAGSGSAPVERSPAPFAIDGSLKVPLSPGISAPLDLLIDNPGDSGLLVRRIEVMIVSVDAPDATAALPCSPDDFRIQPGRGSVTLNARGSTTLSESGWSVEDQPSLGMLDSKQNQDGCKGAVVNLEYHAVGYPQ